MLIGQLKEGIDSEADSNGSRRIAANHILNTKRREAETQSLTFARYGAAFDATPDLDLPDPKGVPVNVPLFVEEANIGCTMRMLLCLDRMQRLIFTLGEILGASDAVGGEVLEMTADNFHQYLVRARRDLYSFMHNRCGTRPCHGRTSAVSNKRNEQRAPGFRRLAKQGRCQRSDLHI